TLLAVARHRRTEISNPFPSSRESCKLYLDDIIGGVVLQGTSAICLHFRGTVLIFRETRRNVIYLTPRCSRCAYAGKKFVSRRVLICMRAGRRACSSPCLNGTSKGAKKGAKSGTHGPIPYASEQGIFCTLAGN